MKIAVVHGSPSGKHSATLQYINYIAQRFPKHEFDLLDVGRGMGRIEKSPERVAEIVNRMTTAEAILWSFPVYTCLAPASFVRFIEILFASGPSNGLCGKVATTLTTSEHFYDHTAHAYMEAVSEDLGMSVFKGFSAETTEILRPEGRRNLEGFIREFLRVSETGAPLERHHIAEERTTREYGPTPVEANPKRGQRRITLITDVSQDEHNLSAMIDRFTRRSKHPVDVFNLHDIGMKGGCLGCLRCVYDGTCVYKDGFAAAFDERIQTADALIFAGTIRHRYLSSTFKAYFDRNFRNGHRPVLHGKPIGWIISGPLRQNANLRHLFDAMVEIPRSPRLGIVTDEYDASGEISARIDELARSVDRLFAQEWIRPSTFLGFGGRKVFRDLMYGMRGIVRADHRYYKKNGLYDFPQKDLRKNVFNWTFGAMMDIPWSRDWLLRQMGNFKLAQFKGIVKKKP